MRSNLSGHKIDQSTFKPALGKPQNELLSDMDLPLRRTFYPLGFAVEIITNDPDVLRAADESLVTGVCGMDLQDSRYA